MTFSPATPIMVADWREQMRAKRKAASVGPFSLWHLWMSDNDSAIRSLMSGKLSQDLKKVQFDFENYTIDICSKIGDGWHGVRQEYVKGGYLSMLCCSAGGDWEYPVNFIIYLDKDNRTLRGYVPKAGNTWNYKTKEAFGNDEDEDYKFLKNQFKLDIEPDGFEALDYCHDMSSVEKMREEILGRIEVVK